MGKLRDLLTKASNDVAGLLGQAIFATLVTVLFILSGYASRAGLQSLTMLAVSTGLLASRGKGEAKWLGFGASGVLAAGAGYVAFGLDAADPRSWPVTLGVGFGSWLLVGAILLARRNTSGWTWLVGSATWLGISLTYGFPAIVAAAGKLATYLWVPWASAGFLVSAWLLPRILSRKWPRPVPTAMKWAGGMARGVAMGFLVAFAVTTVLAQMGATAPASAPACDDCAPGSHLLAMQATAVPDGVLVVARFQGTPSGLRMSFEGIAEPIEVREEAGGWTALGNGREVDVDTLAVSRDNETILVLLRDRALWRPIAVEGIDGNRLPEAGFFAPRQAAPR